MRQAEGSLELGIELHWSGTDAIIEADVGGYKIGMKEITIHGSLLVGLCPLLDVLPITGGVSITFPNPPELSWTWTGLGKAIPEKTVRGAILEALRESVVIPHRIFVDIASGAGLPDEEGHKMRRFRAPPPLGVLRVELCEARDLLPADLGGASDPYGVVALGAREFTSRRVDRALNPKWQHEAWDFFVYHLEQEVFVSIYDSDKFSADEFLGSIYVVSAEGARKRPSVAHLLDHDCWWPLDISHHRDSDKHDSRVLLRCQWASVQPGLRDLRPLLLDCPGAHGLRPLRAQGCSLCGLSVGWRERLGLERRRSHGCEQCGFLVCDGCLVRRRRSCGIATARLHWREGSLTLELEGARQQAKPQPKSPEHLERREVVAQLRAAGVEPEVIARCLRCGVEDLDADPDEGVVVHFLVRDPAAQLLLELQPSPSQPLGLFAKVLRQRVDLVEGSHRVAFRDDRFEAELRLELHVEPLAWSSRE